MARTASELTPAEVLIVESLEPIGTALQQIRVNAGATALEYFTAGGGSGDVVGPASATDNAIARFDNTTGKLIQNSAATIADTTGDITAGKYNTVAISGSATPTLAVTGTTTVSGANTGDQTNISGNAGTVTNGVYTTDAGTVFLAPNGSAASLTSFPTLNQNTSGYAEALKSATTTVSVSAATAPSSGQVLTATSGTAATWQTPSGGSFSWGATASGTSGVGLTLTKQSGASYNMVAESDYDGNPEINLYQNFTGGTANTFANFGFRRKLDDANNREIAGIVPYTITKTSTAAYNGGLILNLSNSGSGGNLFGFDYLGRMTVGTYSSDATEGGTNGLLFASGTAATIINATKGYLYNNSGTLTWVNSGADNQMALNIPNSSSSVIGQVVTVGNTQTNAQTGIKVDTGTSAQGHTGLLINAYNASTTASAIKIDLSTTYTGSGIRFIGTGGNSTKVINFSATISNTGSTNYGVYQETINGFTSGIGYGIYQASLVGASTGTGYGLSQNFVCNGGGTGYGIHQVYVSSDTGTGYGIYQSIISNAASSTGYGWYVNSIGANNAGNVGKYFSLNNAQTGTSLQNRTNDASEILFSRTGTHTSGTKADNFNLSYFKRTSVQNGAGGTFTSAGSVLKLENVATQTAGTLTDTVDVLLLDQDTDSTGKILNARTGGTTKFAISATGALTTTPLTDGAVGFLNIPQNSQSAAYTTVAADSGKHIYHPSADTTARTWTIDSNANVAYPIGTAISFVNDISAGVLTISITSDTLVLAGSGTTGSRTLAAGNIATAIKITSTKWMISGSSGLT